MSRIISTAGLLKSSVGLGALISRPFGPGPALWTVPHGHDFLDGICQRCSRTIEEMPSLPAWRRTCTGKMEGFK